LIESSRSSDEVEAYARAVVEGRVAAGRWHRLACARHLSDLAKSADDAEFPYVYRADLALRAFALFAMFRHYKGSEWAGRPVILEPWQKFIIGSLMGWVERTSGLRRYRNAFIELPRGNGKSTLAGGVLVMFGFFLGESGAEAYSVATKKDQAKISFQAGRQMVLRSSALRKHITIGKYNLHSEATESKMEALGADADTLDGLRPYVVVVDEVHKIPSSDLVDVMESGMGTRPDPLLFEITTAGRDEESLYGRHRLLSTRVLEGVIEIPEWFAFIAAADPDDDWKSETTWRKANPNYGVSVKADFLRKELRKALANPHEQPKFRLLYLGQNIQTIESYFSIDAWAACPALPDDAELLLAPCWIGLDLSSSVDITAAVLVWQLPEHQIAIRPVFWLPAERIDQRGDYDRLPYERWSSEALPGETRPILRLTEGRTIDFQRVRLDVVELCKRWKVKTVAADPWQMREFAPALAADGIQVVLVPQTYPHLSQPMKSLQGRILDRTIRHDRNPLMTVMVANVTPRYDDKGNVLPSKKRSRGRIDGVSAVLNAITQLPTALRPQFAPFFIGGAL